MGSSKYSSTIIDLFIFCSMFCNLKSENLKNKLFPIATSATNFQVHKKVWICFVFLNFAEKSGAFLKRIFTRHSKQMCAFIYDQPKKEARRYLFSTDALITSDIPFILLYLNVGCESASKKH